MNDNNVHWYLCLVDVVEQQVLILDSLPMWPNEHRYIAVKNVVKELDRVLELVGPKHSPTLIHWPITQVQWAPRQNNSYDCGIFVIKMMSAPILVPSFKITV